MKPYHDAASILLKRRSPTRCEAPRLPDRRQFLSMGLAAGGFSALLRTARATAGEEETPAVAAIITEFTYRSHAHVILENFLKPYLFNGRRTDSRCRIASMYVDQFPAGDMARGVSREFGIPIFPTIKEALCLGDTDLAVDAVLSIGEHGTYPVNERGQMEYPRKRFFDEIAAVCRTSGRAIPVFNDKHLSYRWDWAKEMYDVSRQLGIPLMAGSSVPLAERRPPLEIPSGAAMVEAVSIHGGGIESYDFHALEVLESMVEQRRGGETGVREVSLLEGESLWDAADDGTWSLDLARAAMVAELGPEHPLTRSLDRRGRNADGEPVPAHAILLRYQDGLRATALKLGNSATRWNFACRLADDDRPLATAFYVGPWDNRNLFKALAHAIQTHFHDRRAPYPVERTLLCTGILDASLESRARGGQPQATPHLQFAYQTTDLRPYREMGASWKIITPGMPEPAGIDPGPV
jgi:hypothetical protein